MKVEVPMLAPALSMQGGVATFSNNTIYIHNDNFNKATQSLGLTPQQLAKLVVLDEYYGQNAQTMAGNIYRSQQTKIEALVNLKAVLACGMAGTPAETSAMNRIKQAFPNQNAIDNLKTLIDENQDELKAYLQPALKRMEELR